MAIALRTIAFPYRAVASFVILVGIARVSGLWSANPSWNSFLYYTVMSNVLCLAWMVWSAIVTLRDAQSKGWHGYSTPSARGEAAVMHAITVTILSSGRSSPTRTWCSPSRTAHSAANSPPECVSPTPS